MARDYRKIFTGLQLIGQSSIAPTLAGESRYNSSTNKLELFDIALRNIVTNSGAETLTNKTITATGNTLTLTGYIVNSDINASAAIAYSKLTLTGSILNTDLAGSIDLTTKVAGILSINNGGTGQSTQGAAFDALSLITTKGDLPVRSITAVNRLPIGSNGQILTADSTQTLGMKWAAGVATLAVQSKIANYTVLTSDDGIFGDASGGVFTLTLFTAVGNLGKTFTATNYGTSNNIILDANSSETIGGFLTINLAPNDSIDIYSDGSNWQIRSWSYKRQAILGAAQILNGTTTSGTFAAFSNTATVTFIPIRTSKFKISGTFIAAGDTAGFENSLSIKNTSGAATINLESAVRIDQTDANFSSTFSPVCIASLNAGTSYTFEVQGLVGSGIFTLQSNAFGGNGSVLVVEEIN